MPIGIGSVNRESLNIPVVVIATAVHADGLYLMKIYLASFVKNIKITISCSRYIR